MVTRHAFGGEISTQGAMYATAFLVVVSVGLGYYNIKRRQIEEHRKWMLRQYLIPWMSILCSPLNYQARLYTLVLSSPSES